MRESDVFFYFLKSGAHSGDLIIGDDPLVENFGELRCPGPAFFSKLFQSNQQSLDGDGNPPRFSGARP